MTTKYHGGCACGAIRYEARGEPINPHYCHCALCRRTTGAPVVAWVNFVEDTFSWTCGQPSMYASSAVMQRGFCERCGTSLCTLEDDGYVCVTIASLDRAEDVSPQYHIYEQYRLPWFTCDDGLSREHRADRA